MSHRIFANLFFSLPYSKWSPGDSNTCELDLIYLPSSVKLKNCIWVKEWTYWLKFPLKWETTIILLIVVNLLSIYKRKRAKFNSPLVMIYHQHQMELHCSSSGGDKRLNRILYIIWANSQWMAVVAGNLIRHRQWFVFIPVDRLK